MAPELPILTVVDAVAWSRWLASSGRSSSGVWLTLAKKNVSKPTSLTYAQALDEALCHGWIDGQRRGGDDSTYGQRFTPRTAKSTWSQRNVAHIARLESQAGRIQEQGRLAIEAAKADGRWDAAYAGASTAELPSDFLDAVAAVPAAQLALNVLPKQERFAMYLRLTTLKTAAGREKRIAAFVEMLAGEVADKATGGTQGRVPAKKSSKTGPSKRAVVTKPTKPSAVSKDSVVNLPKKRKTILDAATENSGCRKSTRLSRDGLNAT
ncbi:YdeI/OmpD-associated family protein [Microdochium nivale]|nr:YdeI/OmpD-associated family protein [Microdochium nivale]